jgi:hypothetical protein
MTKTEGRRVAMRVQDFAAGKKGVTRAIQEFKVRKQRKVQKKAVLLRQYKKVIKKEGYDDVVRRPNKPERPPTYLAKPKLSNPSSQKCRPAQNDNKEEEERQAKQQQRHAQEKKRHEISQKLSKRTRRGQPVMKYVIHNILDKLQKEES